MILEFEAPLSFGDLHLAALVQQRSSMVSVSGSLCVYGSKQPVAVFFKGPGAVFVYGPYGTCLSAEEVEVRFPGQQEIFLRLISRQ